MGKSRQGSAGPGIIDRPELKSPLRNFTEGSITLALWIIWVYWLLPVMTLIFWIFGLKVIYKLLFSGVDLLEVMVVLKNSGAVILIIFTLQIIWVLYNYYIFKKVGERRKRIFIFPEEKIAELFKVDSGFLAKTKEFNRLEVSLKKDHQVLINHYSNFT